MRHIDKIIVHCTATPEGKYFDVKDVDKWHKDRGWSGIGYHYLILLDGTVQTGRPIEKIGAHVAGHNADSIGVSYIGGMTADMSKSKDTRTQKQRESLIHLLTKLKCMFPLATIYGHSDFANKACPCFDAKHEYEYISNG